MMTLRAPRVLTGEAECCQKRDSSTKAGRDVVPVCLERLHRFAVKVGNLEPDAGFSREHQAGLQDQLLANVEPLAEIVEFVDQLVDVTTRVPVFPLRCGQAKQQVQSRTGWCLRS